MLKSFAAANIAVPQVDGPAEATAGAAFSARRIALNTFAFGTSHDAKLLNDLATMGHGVYAYLKSKRQLGLAFADFLGGVVSTVAQELSLVIHDRPGASAKIESIQTTLDHEQVNPTTWIVRMADLQAEERRDLIVHLNGAQPNETQLFDAYLEYHDMLKDEDARVEVVFATDVPQDDDKTAIGIATKSH
eukprot:GABV01000261.1.p3 GENE.GABV01000261.1~~GABV01000261.1.p3  ORF type:complete len:190 (-),score=72.96 GABV01000261.1:741-1310(-)